MKRVINILLCGIFFMAIIASVIPAKSTKKINLSESSLVPLPQDISKSMHVVKLASISETSN
jgi:hypothetical protein